MYTTLHSICGHTLGKLYVDGNRNPMDGNTQGVSIQKKTITEKCCVKSFYET